MWTPHLKRSARPIFQVIADAMEDDIGARRLVPGEQLPTHRQLAKQLNLTVRTVTRAYTEANRRGLTEGRVGCGTFVRPDVAKSNELESQAPPGVIDLSLSTPPVNPAAVSIPDTLRGIADHTGLHALLNYQPSAGTPQHREAGAAWVSRPSWKASPDQVIVCVGAQHALTVTLGTIAPPRSVVLTEALNYPGVRRAAEFLHLDLRGVPIDNNGMQPEALARMIETLNPAAVITTPTAHNPTCATMPLERRKAIAAILDQHNIPLIEDDLCSRAVAPELPLLFELRERRSYYISSTSKVAAPGLRVSYLVAHREEIPRLTASVYATSVSVPALMVEIASAWMADGTADRLLGWHRREASERITIAQEAFQDLPFGSAPSCYHIWLPLPSPWRANEFVAEAGARGVVVTPADAFAIGRDVVPHAIRIGLGSARSQNDLKRALRTLAALARSRASGHWQIV